MKAILALTALLAAGAVNLAFTHAEPTTTRLMVETYSGDLYIAGQGDDCRAAWEGAVIPTDWHSIKCVTA